MENEKCRFVGIGKYCQILVGVKCDGTDKLCKCRDTIPEFACENWNRRSESVRHSNLVDGGDRNELDRR